MSKAWKTALVLWLISSLVVDVAQTIRINLVTEWLEIVQTQMLNNLDIIENNLEIIVQFHGG
jgi:hypothetical protein